MGYATVVSGGEDGRYTIEIDTGEWRRVELLAAINAAISQLEIQLVDAQAKLDEAEAKEQTQRDAVQYEIDAYAAAAADLPPGTTLPQADGITFELNKLRALEVNNQPIRALVDALKFDLAAARKQAAAWNTLQALEVRPAWCADLTEDRAAGSQVGTIEIPGEPKLVLIAPGARGWMPSDGFLMSRELQRPDQLFVNAALLPGVTKWRPTYRWGTCTAKDDDANTMSVSLAAQTAAGLSVNQGTTLTGVPVSYMWCNSKAFEVGDRVVVSFTGQDWSSPVVIGFVDNPKPCGWLREFSVGYRNAMGDTDPVPGHPFFLPDEADPPDITELYVPNEEDADPVTASNAPTDTLFIGWYRLPAATLLLTRSQELIETNVTSDGAAQALYAVVGWFTIRHTLVTLPYGGTGPQLYEVRFQPSSTQEATYDFPTLPNAGPFEAAEATAYAFPSFEMTHTSPDGYFSVSATYVFDSVLEPETPQFKTYRPTAISFTIL